MCVRLRRHQWALPSEQEHLTTLFKATVAIHASIMLWVGSWGLIALEKKRDGASTDDALFRTSLTTYVVYSVLGTLLCIATDTFYGNAGLEAGYLHPRYSKNRILYAVRLGLAWVGTMLMWSGLYNVIDLDVFPADFRAEYRSEIDGTLFVTGIALLWVSDSFYWVCYLDPFGLPYVFSPTYTSGLQEHLTTVVRVLVSVIGQTFLSLAFYDFLENNPDVMGETTVYRELFYGLLGALLLVWTDAWIPLSWMDLEEDSSPDSEGVSMSSPGKDTSSSTSAGGTYTVLFDLRCFIALVGQLIHNTAVWTVLDMRIFPGQPIRHGIYIAIGAAGLLATGTLGTNFGMAVAPVDPGETEADILRDEDAEDAPLLRAIEEEELAQRRHYIQ
eukprot:m.24780 g.24780  ORF g.24780 m.24780 type:complete len:387 (-) comp4063_c0_seq1:266-1426(-)